MKPATQSEPFYALAAALKEGGHPAHAKRIEDVLNGVWTTSTELIGELGAAVLAIRDEGESLTPAQRRLIRRCLEEVRKTWPGFGIDRVAAGQWLTGAACVAFGVFILVYSASSAGPPPAADLDQVEGRVIKVEVWRNSVRFRLAGDERHFQYLSNAGAENEVAEALLAAGQEQVVVAFDRKRPSRPWSAAAPLWTVFEISIGGRTIRTFAQTSQAWSNNDRIAPWLAGAFIVSGALLGFRAYRRR